MSVRALLDAAAALRRSGEDYLIATVVGVRGSAYRRPGARMIVTRERWLAGSVSGGCLEGDIMHRGFWRLDGTGPQIITYDSTRDDDDGDDDLRTGLALGCNGVVEILLERGGTTDLDPLLVVDLAVTGQQRAVLATVLRSPRIPTGARLAIVGDGPVEGALPDLEIHAAIAARLRATVEGGRTHTFTTGTTDVLVEVITPPPRLFVIGGGHDAVPLVTQARAVGWDVLVSLPHARPVARERFPCASGFVFGEMSQLTSAINASHRAAAVVMNHQYERDREALAALVASRAAYIGMLGPRHRTARILAELGLAEDPRLHAPVGLAVGAETPEEIALAIVAEVQTVLTETTARRLREKAGPIHAATRSTPRLVL